MTGKRLRGLRKSKKISQAQMAFLLGVHKNTYERWERNPSMMSVKWLPKIGKILGINPYEVFRLMQGED